jgi:hypothetical protein
MSTKINSKNRCRSVSWNAPLDRGGIVVGDLVEITIDAEAILEEP